MSRVSPETQLCDLVVDRPAMSNATARTAAWLVAVARRTGGFPLELTATQIRDGLTRNGVTIPGTGARHETIKRCLDWLEDAGILEVKEGQPTGFGFSTRIYDWRA